MGRAAMIAHSFIIILYAFNYPPVPRRVLGHSLRRPRLRSDCIRVRVFLYEEKSTRLPILLCKYFNLAGAPKRTVGYLVMVLFVWQNQKSWYKCRFRFFQNRMVNPYGKFSEPGFPHNFAKNDRQDLKIGCTDASRRQLQSVLKIGV